MPSFKQILLLTLAPDSWTQQKTASYFNVKFYSVRKAASLKKEQGILPKLDDVTNLVKIFYEDDELLKNVPLGKGV